MLRCVDPHMELDGRCIVLSKCVIYHHRRYYHLVKDLRLFRVELLHRFLWIWNNLPRTPCPNSPASCTPVPANPPITFTPPVKMFPSKTWFFALVVWSHTMAVASWDVFGSLTRFYEIENCINSWENGDILSSVPDPNWTFAISCCPGAAHQDPRGRDERVCEC